MSWGIIHSSLCLASIKLSHFYHQPAKQKWYQRFKNTRSRSEVQPVWWTWIWLIDMSTRDNLIMNSFHVLVMQDCFWSSLFCWILRNRVTHSIPVSGEIGTKRIRAPDDHTRMPPRLTRTKARKLALADGSGTSPDTQELPPEGQTTATHNESIIDMTTVDGKSFDIIFGCPNYQPHNY
jgi:hypothetical protein